MLMLQLINDKEGRSHGRHLGSRGDLIFGKKKFCEKSG